MKAQSALRRGGALLVLVLVLAAWPTTTVAATSTSARKTTVSQSVTPARHARGNAAHRSRRLRRPPGGVVYARNAILLDTNTDSVLYEKNSQTQAPIASLTKLMTAL